MKTDAKSLSLTQNAITVLQKRYLKRDENGNVVETPEDLFKRVAKAIASVDRLYGKTDFEVKELEDDFYELISSLKFLPNSPTLMNAGRRLGQLSACFVIPVEDSMESIFDAIKYAAIIHKSGGGTGFSFSKLRPKGDVVGSTKGISSGPVSFMTVFDSATEAVKQGGTRRGANMGILRVDHPDILEFITCKDNNDRLNNFNISVAITDSFMRALIEDKEYNLINPRTKKVVGSLRAKEVFQKIVNQAWKNGEPGIVFIDRINESNPTPEIGEIESTNPCGEQPLLPFESCNLGSINLARMVRRDGKDSIEVDWETLRDTVYKAVHFLDNVIDANKYPLKMIEEMTKANRKIGLGIMGWADMLIQLKIPYNSEIALDLAEKIMKFIQDEARRASQNLAEMRGPFPNLSKSIYKEKILLRNATLTTIAPTGTLSIIAGCSSGIEPLFAVAFVRNVLEGTKLIEVNPYFEGMLKEYGLWNRDLVEKCSQSNSIQNLKELPEEIRRIFVTSHDISPSDHIRMQASFQKYTDNAVSKTVNFPNYATPKDVEEVFLLAYNLGCKGVTVYRDGSRQEQVLSTVKKKIEESPDMEITQRIIPKKRPTVIKGTTRLMKTGCGNLYVTINEDSSGRPFEVFTNIGKAGGCASSQAEAIGRLISLALRSNVEPEEVIKQLKGISCHQPTWHESGRILSCSDAIAKALERYQPLSVDINVEKDCRKTSYIETMLIGACPECGSAIQHEEGCAKCYSCGYTKC
ncbi:MAG: vitamin B12-dependent ribonucleotide reductase [Thermodesulfovibrionales bacterium]|nr:vitamin B12-dependent ribonucleotide reductase [Thermodesulfovibrionales bacterium]